MTVTVRIDTSFRKHDPLTTTLERNTLLMHAPRTQGDSWALAPRGTFGHEASSDWVDR
jgi:hypothetical protein